MEKTQADNLVEVMLRRREQILFRLGSGLIAVALFFITFGDLDILLWGIAYASFQALERIVFSRDRIAKMRDENSHFILAISIFAINTAVFAAVTFVELPRLGLWDIAFGQVILACILLNVAQTTHGCKSAFLASVMPALVYLIILPIVAQRAFGCPIGATVTICTAGVAMVFGTIKLWSQAGAAHEAEREAQLELLKNAETLSQAVARAEAANDAKSAFLATMSHEIRTPLNGVLGMAQAMAAEDLNATQRERLAVVRQSGETLLAILNDILDLSKIEAGKLELESIEFSLAAVAAGCHAAFANLAMHKEISFLFMIDEDAKGLYLGDPTRLRQILYNLLSNAMKFTSVGEVSVGVSYVEDRLIIAVKDSGVGMTPEQTERLFRKFAQADASTTRKFGGTGLGLAIVRELALAMGGDVEVRSVLGEGTTLRVSLGLPRVGPEIIETAELESDEGDHDQASYDAINVLVAEDNEINQLVIKTLLNQGGSVPFVVATGKLALEAWETGRWDVILMDVQMPEMDGPTATRLIRERESQTGRRRTPILALTANAMTHQVNEYVAAGMDGHIAKPIEASKLFAALEDVLSGVDFAESDMPSDARLSSQVGT